jgi:hypothetical protein
MIHKKGAKLDPPLRLDMSFEEALERFIGTDPKEVDESIERSKTKRPPQDDAPRRSGRSKSVGSEAQDRQRRKPDAS